MKELTGCKILSIEVNDVADILIFNVEGRESIVYLAVGDCCSETWFADIFGVDALLGGTVSKVERMKLPDYNTYDGRGRQDVDLVYGYKIVTDKGYADVVYRNSSNGWYGGWVEYYPRSDCKFTSSFTFITDEWRSQ